MTITPRDILIANGTGTFIQTFNNSTDAVKPGHIVTTEAESQKDVAWPDQALDCTTGVVGCAPGHDIDTAYSVGDMMPVYMTGSGAVVWVRYRTSAGGMTAGEIVSGGGATIDGLTIIGIDNATQWNYVGRITHLHTDIAAEAWIKVRLSI